MGSASEMTLTDQGSRVRSVCSGKITLFDRDATLDLPSRTP
jgi:hypothetical protein